MNNNDNNGDAAVVTSVTSVTATGAAFLLAAGHSPRFPLDDGSAAASTAPLLSPAPDATDAPVRCCP